MQRLCAISVDLDAIRFYREIHGLSPRDGHEQDPVLSVAVRRLAEWARAHALPLTWFVVGRDLDSAEFAEILLGLCHRGHELANHSLDHLYDLTRRGRRTMLQQVKESSARLSELTSKPRHGFRAPGYTMTDELHAILRTADVLYDSSVFPCPLYYGAKAMALLAQRLVRRDSRAILDNPRVLTAPREPYRLGECYLDRGNGVIELPIQVTRGLRLPFIGTAFTILPAAVSRTLVDGVRGDALINLELHGIDALDCADGLQDLVHVQPDLRVSWKRKLQKLDATVIALRDADYRFATLQQLAEEYACQA